MNKNDIIRAWKDQDFRQSLTSDELANMPSHPASTVQVGASEAKSQPETFSGGSAICTPCPPLYCY